MNGFFYLKLEAGRSVIKELKSLLENETPHCWKFCKCLKMWKVLLSLNLRLRTRVEKYYAGETRRPFFGIFFYFRSPSFTRELTRIREKIKFWSAEVEFRHKSFVYRYYNSIDNFSCCLIATVCLIQSRKCTRNTKIYLCFDRVMDNFYAVIEVGRIWSWYDPWSPVLTSISHMWFSPLQSKGFYAPACHIKDPRYLRS